MTTRYPGGIITKTPVVPSGPYVCSTAPGIWTLDQQLQAQKLGIWPTAGNVYGTLAIFARGSNTTTREKYTYSGCVSAAATASSVASQFGAAAGNATTGIFAIGNSVTTRNKYTYSGDVNAAATASSANSYYGAAAGNATVGIFARGSTTTTREKYTYSGCVSAAATASSATSSGGSAASNGTTGVNV